MFVYFIQAGDAGPIKIGKADKPDRRVKQLQIASPYRLHLRAVCCGDVAAERYLHSVFADHQLEAEWFTATPDLLALVDSLPSYEAVKNGERCPEIVDPSTRACRTLYALGYDYADIGEAAGFTKQRAHQVVTGYGQHFRKTKPVVPSDRPARPDEPVQQAYDRLMTEYAPLPIEAE